MNHVSGPARLVLPRAYLDHALRDLPRHTPDAAPLLAHGPLVMQEHPWGTELLGGWLQRIAWRQAWTSTPAHAPGADGLLMLHVLQAGETMPQNTGAEVWSQATAWLNAHASGYHLATPVLSPALAVLWLSRQGHVFAVWRRNDESPWQRLDGLDLPGSGMHQLNLGLNAAQTDVEEGDPVHGRYSRLQAALGKPVFQRLIAQPLVQIGLGRTGSPMAHSWVRMGGSLLAVDPDRVELHNLDGDVLPSHEGLNKSDACARFLRPLLKPGAAIDGRGLSIDSPVMGVLMSRSAVMSIAVDDDLPRLWANCWALASHKVQLVVANQVRNGQAEADIKLLPPGTGCQWCVGGFVSSTTDLLERLRSTEASRGVDFREQRQGSLRSWSVATGQLALRLLERLYAGNQNGGLFRQIRESNDGEWQVQDRIAQAPQPNTDCPFCRTLAGAGSAAVTRNTLVRLLEEGLHTQQDGRTER